MDIGFYIDFFLLFVYMDVDKKVRVYIEIEKNSNVKYEYNKETKRLEIDRILPEPYCYPFSYGFIENTLAMDEDELDCLILTDKIIQNDSFYDVYIIGVLIMEDEKGLDEKMLCVLEEDYDIVSDLDMLGDETITEIEYFFANYKNTTPNKWSKVHGYENKEFAIQLYHKYLI